ncbi:MAG TPA: ATP-binding protein [Alphaproteobacteria bacterium]|nr:ATP-binding protein [Alphaproteobacteria bacterium]
MDRLIFGTVGVGLYQATTAGRFLRANPKLAEILGWPSTETLIDEVVDIGAQLYVEPDFRAAKLAALGCSGHTQFVTEVRRRDGRRILISESACAVPGPQGGASFYIGSMTEVTELMAAQDALQTIERSYRDLFENATEGIFRSDPDGRILSANPAFVRLLGYDNERQMMLSINERGFVHYVDPRRSLEFRRRIMESGRLTNFESELVRRSGERIWVSENARVVRDRSGKVRWYEGTVQDISDRKRVEATLRHAQEAAERANDAKTRFLAAASHDLRQPYQAMRLLLHAVASRQIDAQSKALARRLDEAMTAGENLLNALLDISKLEGGMVRPHITNFAVDTLLDRLHGEFAPQAAARGQLLQFIRSRVQVRSDPVLLERIIRNLVLNAIRHSPGGRILVGCRRTGDWVRLEVWDNGPGIPKDKLEEIFEEFSQLANEERDSSRGHGLGLAIVKGLTRVLGHKVSVRSVLGRGTVFAVTIPAAENHAGSARGAAARADALEGPRAGSQRSVLVIEDEPAQRMSLSLLLEDWGYLVRSAADLASALRELEQWGEQPSFVVSDFRLPGGCNGVEAIREIGRHVGRQVPGIILTGDTDPARLREARQSGCILMHKPVSLGSLRHAVSSLSGTGDRLQHSSLAARGEP